MFLPYIPLLLCFHLSKAQPNSTVEDPANTPALPVAVIATFSVIALMAVISVTGVCCHRKNKARRDKKVQRRIMELASSVEETSEVYPNPYSLQSSLFSSLPNLPLPTVGTGTSGPPSLRDAYGVSRLYGDSSPRPGSVNSRRNSPACLARSPKLFQPTCSENSSRPNTPFNGNSSDPNYCDTNWAVATTALPADAIVALDDLAQAKNLRDELRPPPKLKEEELASAISHISRIASMISETTSSANVPHSSYPKHPFPYATNHRRIPSTSSAIIRFTNLNVGRVVKSDEEQIQDLKATDEKYEVKSDEGQIANLEPADGYSEGNPHDEQIQDLTAADGECSKAKTSVEDTANNYSSETLTSPNENSSWEDAMDPGFSFGLSAKERRRIERDDGHMCVEEDACTYSSDFESAHESFNNYRQFSCDGNTQGQHCSAGCDSDDGSAKLPIHANDAMPLSTEPCKHVPPSPRISLASMKEGQGHSWIPGDDERQIPITPIPSMIVDPHLKSTASPLHLGSEPDLTAMGNVIVSPPSRSPSPSAIRSLGIAAHPQEMIGVEGPLWADDCPLPPPLPIGRWQKHHSLPHPRTISAPHHLAPYQAYPQPTFRHQHSLAGYSHSSYSTSSTSFSSLVLPEVVTVGQIQQQNWIEAERQHETRRSALRGHPALASLLLDDRREAHGGRC